MGMSLVSREPSSAARHVGPDTVPGKSEQAIAHVANDVDRTLGRDLDWGLLGPQDLSLRAGCTRALPGGSLTFSTARQGPSSPSVTPSAAMGTCRVPESSTHTQHSSTSRAWPSAYALDSDRGRDRGMTGSGIEARSGPSPSPSIPEHMKSDFCRSSVADKRVVVRIRGMSFSPRGLSFTSGNKLALCVHPTNQAKILCNRGTCLQEFHFSRVFAGPDTNEDVYRDIGGDRIVVALGHGIKETILAYGQTGSGKTHSLFGTGQEKGLAQLFIQSLFGRRKAAQLNQTISVCVIEVLGDMLYDLLPDWNCTPEDGQPSRMRWEECFIKTGKFRYKVVTVDDEQAALRILEEARQQRKVGGSHLNSRSSRSHAIVQFFVQTTFSEDQAGSAPNHMRPDIGRGDCAFYGVLTLADLAGCEREQPSYLPRKMGASTSITTKEEGKAGSCSRALNTSISALNRLMRKMQTGALDESDRRQSALNRVLFDYLQPECGVCMLFCLNPEASELPVSLSTLTIASDCRFIACSRRQHILRVEPSHKAHNYDDFFQSSIAVKSPIPGFLRAAAPVCTVAGSPGVRGGERSLCRQGVIRGQESSTASATVDKLTGERESTANSRGHTLHCGTPDRLLRRSGCFMGQADTMCQTISEKKPPHGSHTRETQTEESCLCVQAFVPMQCETRSTSCSSVRGHTRPCDENRIVLLALQRCPNDAESAAAERPPRTAGSSASGTRNVTSQSEAQSHGAPEKRDSFTLNEESVTSQRGEEMVHHRGSSQDHAACCSVSPLEKGCVRRDERGNEHSWRRWHLTCHPAERSRAPAATERMLSSTCCEAYDGAVLPWYTRAARRRRNKTRHSPVTGQEAVVPAEPLSAACSPESLTSPRGIRLSPSDRPPDEGEALGCSCSRQRAMSPRIRCSPIAGDSRGKMRGHRRCRKNADAEQLQKLALHHLCEQQEEEIQAEIQRLEDKLISLMQLCALERESFARVCKAPVTEVARKRAVSNINTSQELVLCSLPEGRGLETHDGCRGSHSAANVPELQAPRTKGFDDGRCQRASGRNHAVREATSWKAQGGNALHTADHDAPSRTAAAACDYADKAEGGSPAEDHRRVKIVCTAARQSPRSCHTESGDEPPALKQEDSGHSFLRDAKSTKVLRAVSLVPAVHAFLSGGGSSSTPGSAEPSGGGTVQLSGEKHALPHAPRHPDTSGESTRVPTRRAPAYRGCTALQSVDYSHASPPRDGQDSMASVDEVETKTQPFRKSYAAEEAHLSSAFVGQRLAPATNQTPSGERPGTNTPPAALKAHEERPCNGSIHSEVSTRGMTRGGSNKGATVTESLGGIPVSSDQSRAGENVSDIPKTPPTLARSCVDGLQLPSSSPLAHRRKRDYVEGWTLFSGIDETRRLQQRLRELLHLRQQRRWPQSDEALQTTTRLVDEPPPGHHAEHCIQDEMNRIIQLLQGLRSGEAYERRTARVLTSGAQAAGSAPLDFASASPGSRRPSPDRKQPAPAADEGRP